jgi:PilZ domain
MHDPETGAGSSRPDSEAAEGRRWSRHKIDVRLKVSAAMKDGTTSSVFGRGNSLSHGGLGAYIPSSIPVGSTIDLELTFPHSSKEVKLKAIVRSCEGFRYGLEFIEVPAEVQRTIVKGCDDADPFR